MIAAPTQRPGWRTGTALMSSGRICATAVSVSAVGVATALSRLARNLSGLLANCSVDRRVRDRALLDAPLLQDGLVRAVGHEDLQRVADRLGHAVALGDRDPVRRGVVRAARQLELTVRLLDDVSRDGRVSHSYFPATARESEIRRVLIREDENLHGRLACGLA